MFSDIALKKGCYTMLCECNIIHPWIIICMIRKKSKSKYISLCGVKTSTVCLGIDLNFDECFFFRRHYWPVRNTGTPSIAKNANTKGRQTVLYLINRLLFSDVNFVEIKASETLFACCCFTSLCKRYVWFTMFLPHLSLNIILNGDMDSSAQRNIEIYSVVCRYMRYHFMLFTNPTNNEKGLLIGLKPAVQSFF